MARKKPGEIRSLRERRTREAFAIDTALDDAGHAQVTRIPRKFLPPGYYALTPQLVCDISDCRTT